MREPDGAGKVLLAIVRALPLRNLSPGQAMFVSLTVLLLIALLAIVFSGATNSPGAVLMFFGLMLFFLIGVTR